MATSDAIGEILAVAAGSSLNIQPTAPDEWIIHNIYIPEDNLAEIFLSDGIDDILIAKVSGSYLGYFFHVRNALYLKVKNTNAGPINIGYDGIAVK